MNALSHSLESLIHFRRARVSAIAVRTRAWKRFPVAATLRALGAAALVGFVFCGKAIADEDMGASEVGATSAFKPGLVYNGVAFTNLHGGVRSGGTYSSNLDLQLNVDFNALFGWPDTIGYLDVLWLQGGLPSSFVGDAQGVSSISAPNALTLYEAWVQKNFLGNHASLLAGIYDLNSEFYRLQSAALFLNSSFGIGPELAQSGVAGPSIFPDTSFGMRADFRPADGVVMRAAVLDGVPLDRPEGGHGVFETGDGALIVAEIAFLNRPQPSDRSANRRSRIGRQAMLGEYDAKIAIGGWHYTATFDDLSDIRPDGQPVRRHGSSGFYVLADQLLYRNPDQPERKLAGFIQAGLGDHRVNRFGSYLGTGLTWMGPFKERPADELGLALAYARNGSHYMSAQHMQDLPVTNAEKTIELTYLAQIRSWLALQPDLQYVITPNTSNSIPNAWALQLRIEMSW